MSKDTVKPASPAMLYTGVASNRRLREMLFEMPQELTCAGLVAPRQHSTKAKYKRCGSASS